MMTSGQHLSPMEGIKLAGLVATGFGWDRLLVESAVDLLGVMIHTPDAQSYLEIDFKDFSHVWDENEAFVRCAREGAKTLRIFKTSILVREALPNTARSVWSSDRTQRFSGVVVKLFENFGFIECDEIGDVHFNPDSFMEFARWKDIHVGVETTFEVIRYEKGPHAVRLETNS